MKNQFTLLLIILSSLSGQVDYSTQIQPILNDNCMSCHNYGGAYFGGVDLSSYDSLMAGGHSGDIVIPGDHQSSILWQEIQNGDMPPGNMPDLSSDEINIIAQWIDEGANEYVLKTDQEPIIPDQFMIYQNYPNPFNPITNLCYELSKDSYVKITIFDILGNVVHHVVNHRQDAGYKTIQWDATNSIGQVVPGGIYFYSIEVQGLTKTKKMILLK